MAEASGPKLPDPPTDPPKTWRDGVPPDQKQVNPCVVLVLLIAAFFMGRWLPHGSLKEDLKEIAQLKEERATDKKTIASLEAELEGRGDLDALFKRIEDIEKLRKKENPVK